jgi:hypothetical protein
MEFNHRRMARGGHGLPKVLPGPAMINRSMPCGRASPETVLWPFQGWPAQRAGGLRLSFTLLGTPCRALMSSNRIDILLQFPFFPFHSSASI